MLNGVRPVNIKPFTYGGFVVLFIVVNRCLTFELEYMTSERGTEPDRGKITGPIVKNGLTVIIIITQTHTHARTHARTHTNPHTHARANTHTHKEEHFAGLLIR